MKEKKEKPKERGKGVLEEVTETENRAGDIVQKANDDTSKILLEARKRAETIISAKDTKGAEKKKQRIEAKKKELESYRKGVIKSAQDKCRQMEKQSEKRIRQGVDYILEKMEATLKC